MSGQEIRRYARPGPVVQRARPAGSPVAQRVQARSVVLPADVELLEDTRHILPGRLRTLVKRGEVAQLTPIQELRPGWSAVYVRRLRARRPAWRRPGPVAAAVVSVSVVAAVGVLSVVAVVWLVAHLAEVVGAVLLAALLYAAVARSGVACGGLHCPGCGH